MKVMTQRVNPQWNYEIDLSKSNLQLKHEELTSKNNLFLIYDICFYHIQIWINTITYTI